MTRTLFFLLLALVSLLGCRTATGPRFDARAASQAKLIALTNLTSVPATNQLDPAWLKPPTNRFTLGPGDRLEIEILGGDATTRGTNAVGPDGKIYFHLLPGLDVWGLTLAETRGLIERELMKYMREQPQIGVGLLGVESQRVWLLGRLNTPGIYPMGAPMTLLEALSLAGGPISPTALASLGGGPVTSAFSEEVADLRRSFVIRDGQPLRVDFHRLLKEGNLSQNIYLRPDDFVYVPSTTTKEVFVLGAVMQPRSMAYREQMSLITAIANAQGTIKDAFLSHVAIVRGSLTEPKIAIVDYKDIVRGKAPDVLLEAGDIVYVPFTPYRTLTRYVDLIVRSFVQTVAINEGARAVSSQAIPVGVNIGVGGRSPSP
jgi:protein involved in polysaccharide export with SLBB domain